jgi:F420-0:gamma-glutamyl ligase
MNFEFIPVKTRIVNPPKDEIWDILDNLTLQDGDIVFITSKILALHQGRCVKADKTTDKVELMKRESSHMLAYKMRGGYHACLTIADNILIPNAGIDESNANGHYVLWPKDTDKLCREIRGYLIQKNNKRGNPEIKNLGVISTDSTTTPLRWGVTGIVTGLSGVKPLNDLYGTEDIFGRKMLVAKVNMVDPLASMAVLLMGEGAECLPIVILRGYKDIPFDENGDMSTFKIAPEDDIYQPLLEVMEKTK